MRDRLPPDGWRHGVLGDVVGSIAAGVSVNSEDRPKQDGELGILKTSCVFTGTFRPDEHKAVLRSEIDRVKEHVKAGHILVSRMNTPELVGANAYVPQTARDLFLPDRLWQLKPCSNVDARWLAYVMGSASFRANFKATATGTSNSMKNISQQSLQGLPILIPPLAEQLRIVRIIRTWDEAIAQAEQLISMKERRFRALLRYLIDEQSSERGWRKVRVAELGDILKGKGIKKTELRHDGVPCIRYGELYTRHHYVVREYYSHVPYDIADQCFELAFGDIVFAASGETAEEIGKCASFVGQGRVVAGGDTLVLRQSENDPIFLGYALNTPKVNRQKRALGKGHSVVHLHTAELRSIEMFLPPLDEQRNIANLLEETNREIELLKELRQRRQLQKRGLMQKLLTGKWRMLIKDASAHRLAKVAIEAEP